MYHPMNATKSNISQFSNIPVLLNQWWQIFFHGGPDWQCPDYLWIGSSLWSQSGALGRNGRHHLATERCRGQRAGQLECDLTEERSSTMLHRQEGDMAHTNPGPVEREGGMAWPCERGRGVICPGPNLPLTGEMSHSWASTREGDVAWPQFISYTPFPYPLWKRGVASLWPDVQRFGNLRGGR